jgi:hypothetical protein
VFGFGPQPPIPNPQSPIPNPQSPFKTLFILLKKIITFKKRIYKIILKNKKS